MARRQTQGLGVGQLDAQEPPAAPVRMLNEGQFNGGAQRAGSPATIARSPIMSEPGPPAPGDEPIMLGPMI